LPMDLLLPVLRCLQVQEVSESLFKYSKDGA
jgi:hypothetical protein